MQLTADSDWGERTTDGSPQALAAASERTIKPACGDAVTVLPTATQSPMEAQETSMRVADEPVTVWLVQVAPPLSVVSSTPRPVRTPSRLVAVVPTTVHLAPATPTTGVGGVGAGGVVGVVGAAPAGTGEVVVGEVVAGGTAPLPDVGPSRHESPSR